MEWKGPWTSEQINVDLNPELPEKSLTLSDPSWVYNGVLHPGPGKSPQFLSGLKLANKQQLIGVAPGSQRVGLRKPTLLWQLEGSGTPQPGESNLGCALFIPALLSLTWPCPETHPYHIPVPALCAR